MHDNFLKRIEVITSLLIVHNQKSKVVPLRLVLDDLIHVIISSASSNQSNEVLKGIWINRIESCAKKANITLQKNDWLCSWSKVERSRNQAVSTERSPSSGSSITENNNNNTTDSYTSSIPSLKTKVTEEDKNRFRKMFDSLNPNNFWVLDATKRAAAAAGPDVNPLSVEEKIASFALNSSNLHPSYSMILDVDEENWKTVFTKEELMEIQNEGSSLIRQTPDELLGLLKAIKKMSVEDIYTYAYSLPHDPTKDHLLTWWSLTLLNAANQFLCENTGTERVGEADTMYNNWSFLSTIFRGSNIQVHG
ncbi:hypothetical protein BDC45DRAFT_119861 [Circinella umbellata]|nr:hypothetical protein BDC45DRAFT_119861 [Circinella umbellata]